MCVCVFGKTADYWLSVGVDREVRVGLGHERSVVAVDVYESCCGDINLLTHCGDKL